MMRIVILDGYTENPGDLSWSGFEQLGELQVYDRTSPQEVVSRIGNAEIVLTNKTEISGEMMKACPAIKYIEMCIRDRPCSAPCQAARNRFLSEL